MIKLYQKKLQKKFYTRLYKLLAKYEAKYGADNKADDRIIIETVFYGVMPSNIDGGEGEGKNRKYQIIGIAEGMDRYELPQIREHRR